MRDTDCFLHPNNSFRTDPSSAGRMLLAPTCCFQQETILDLYTGSNPQSYRERCERKSLSDSIDDTPGLEISRLP
jgi:hypothetical protein